MYCVCNINVTIMYLTFIRLWNPCKLDVITACWYLFKFKYEQKSNLNLRQGRRFTGAGGGPEGLQMLRMAGKQHLLHDFVEEVDSFSKKQNLRAWAGMWIPSCPRKCCQYLVDSGALDQNLLFCRIRDVDSVCLHTALFVYIQVRVFPSAAKTNSPVSWHALLIMYPC